MIRSQGAILERHAHRLEGCECHRDLWTSQSSWARKVEHLRHTTGFRHCYMKGRQAAWFQAVGFDLLLAEIAACTSSLLQELIAKMVDQQANLVRLSTELAEALTEELRDKLGFHNQLPYSAIKIFFGEIKGGSSDRARAFARSAMADYDSVVQGGRSDKLHRVAHIIFRPGQCRHQLEQFANGDQPLSSFHVAHSTVKRYALISLVGRRVEAVHAELKRLGKAATNMMPPLISSTLSEPQNLERLKASRGFFGFCLARWRSTSIYDDILKLVHPRAHLGTLTTAGKINSIYQCGLESEFRDLTIQREVHEEWLAHTSSRRRGGPRKLPQSWGLAVSFLKAKLTSNVVFSLPVQFFDRMLDVPSEADIEFDAVCPWTTIVAMHASAPRCFNHSSRAADVAFFEVVNAVPEHRHNVVLDHLDQWTDTVNITRRTLLSHDAPSGRVILLSVTGAEKTIHLRTFMRFLPECLEQLFYWQLVAHGTAQAIRRQPEQSRVESIAPILVPTTADVLVPRASSAHDIAPFVARPVRDDVAMSVLAQIDALRGPLSEWVQFSALRGCELDDIKSMHFHGALRFRGNAAGEKQVAKNMDGIRAISVQTVGRPLQVLRMDRSATTSKLDLVLALLRSGWVSEEPVCQFALGGERRFFCSRLKPTSYFCCLLEADDIFMKGVDAIPHNLKDIHYQCLLRLTGAPLKEFLEQLQRGGDLEVWARAALKGRAVAVADSGDEGEAAPLRLGHEAAPAAPPLVPAPLLLGDHDWKRALVHVGREPTRKVLFISNLTGWSSGRQRCYMECKLAGHSNCVRHWFCDEFSSREQCCAHLATWAMVGNACEDRVEHIQKDPEGPQVEDTKATMVLEDF